jgi:hypothetical protein
MKKMRQKFITALTAAVACFLLIPTAAADQVILDDLIVDGSACIGLDCVNGESFGFDTLRLKENNLRIKFDDTSVAASFPRNDWQLTANDSANGGASKFSIDDISGGRTPFTVEANSPSHSLYVDDGGRIGLGTSTPSVQLHVIDGDTPTLRLQQDGSSGFTPQTWDVAGNETNFFIRDATNGSTLPFRIRPGAQSSAIEIDVTETVINDGGLNRAFRVESDTDPNALFVDGVTGNVGVGTNAPETPGVAAPLLEIEGTAPRLRIDDTDGGNTTFMEVMTAGSAFWSADVGGQQWQMQMTNTMWRINPSGTPVFELNTSGDLQIDGDLTVLGAGACTGCDGVFDPGYKIESIEEHSEFMWSNSHLPAVGPTRDGEHVPLSLGKRHQAVLNELEKAHIYIERLNERLKEREAAIDGLAERLASLEGLVVGELQDQRNDD